ncbi:DUF3800 domain-containing protein [Bernardetia sp. MNP-M8]|uniref:DUF3800 domain-containing protein n=1 Tax=Bernardetia sp. MNP-M8 TaxID=3127470 RepID=UPI0030CAC744
MSKFIAFADEFGTNSFKFDIGSHFIAASVIIRKDELEDVEKQIEEIRKKYFQTGEIKSSKVSDNHRRRLIILEQLTKINFTVYGVVVDKRKLYGEGFKYKKSFYKFLNGLLYKELFRTFPQLELKVDEHGGNDFMKGFKSYVEENHIRDLFSGSEFHIKKSHNELGVQLADFIAGTLGFIFDETKKSNKSDEFLEILNNKLISLNRFPREFNIKDLDEDVTFSEDNKIIANLSLTRIFDFIDRAKGNKENERDKINFLKLLLLFHQSKHHKEYTTSGEFIKHLNINRDKKISKQYFSSKIIASLRDDGIILASSRSGYKIPTSSDELKKFINHSNDMILPLLKRVEDCRNAVLLATNKDYDILNEPKFHKLKSIIDKTK